MPLIIFQQLFRLFHPERQIRNLKSEGRLFHFYARIIGWKLSFVNRHQSNSTLCRNLPKWSDNIPWSPERKLRKWKRRLTEARLHKFWTSFWKTFSISRWYWLIFDHSQSIFEEMNFWCFPSLSRGLGDSCVIKKCTLMFTWFEGYKHRFFNNWRSPSLWKPSQK